MNEMSEQNNIVLSHPDELMEFLWIKPKISGINVDIFVDDSKSYQRNNRPLLLFARNGYDKSVGEFIPFSISEHPSVLNDFKKKKEFTPLLHCQKTLFDLLCNQQDCKLVDD